MRHFIASQKAAWSATSQEQLCTVALSRATKIRVSEQQAFRWLYLMTLSVSNGAETMALRERANTFFALLMRSGVRFLRWSFNALPAPIQMMKFGDRMLGARNNASA